MAEGQNPAILAFCGAVIAIMVEKPAILAIGNALTMAERNYVTLLKYISRLSSIKHTK
jgi:hypothetical protein